MPDINVALLHQFRFQELFIDIGWEYPGQVEPYRVQVAEADYALAPIVHKRGVQILQALPDAVGRIPPYATRQKIERKITALAREHLIVFTDAAQTTQIWQWVSRAPGRPNQYREVPWRTGESAELLRQKLAAIAFTLDEEETLSVLGVAARLQTGFDRDKVTKNFYREFEKQRKAFADFIAGIPDTGEDLRWYTAVLIDRLMFLWFLQEKLFLDGKKDYLQQRLSNHLQAKHDTSFYRRFLCPLFFRGFAEERTDANRAAIQSEFGKVPYLNGGLFAQHELEQHYGAALDVADAAFEKLFDFFGQWDWHLDDRPLASGREVNPDVLGYIFEKFVNQIENPKGAYYTKEDITEYIGKNTVIPSLLAKVRAEHPGTFDTLAWPLLRESGDAYIYPAMLKGMPPPSPPGRGAGGEGATSGLPTYPPEITAGLDTQAPDLLARRKPWNKRADDTASLPTEIWRETIARHQRTRDLRAWIAAGELRDIGDLITHNLDIRQFAQDLIERCTDVALLKSFWFALAGRLPRKSHEKFRHGLSVLDPTCGSGAFLFAALNILKPLYDATLRTLHAVRGDALIIGEKAHPEKWAEVDEILARFATARSDREQDYAVIKHIIVHNLYGVDIEEQATEIAKLRLFLKLVALLEPGDAIEPLPDIDFNIRHGNTLVGYASANETERAVMGATQGNLFNDAWEDIRIRLIAVEQQYNNFQIQQVQKGGHITAQDKQALVDTLYELEETLNYHLAREYGVDPTKTKKYEAWKASHKPFHWFVDFYPLMAAGGFDVVIGNPPWVEYATVRKFYSVKGYQTETGGNLYGMCTERSLTLSRPEAYFSFIVQLPVVSSSRMACVRATLRNGSETLWVATFDDRPGKLFEGLQNCRSTIFLAKRGNSHKNSWTTQYQRWPTATRPMLLTCIRYVGERDSEDAARIVAKHASELSARVFAKVAKHPALALGIYRSRGVTKHFVFYQEATRYWTKATSALPFYAKNGVQSAPAHGRYIYFDSALKAKAATALLNSSLFYVYFVAYGDCFHLSDTMAAGFSVPELLLQDEELGRLSDELMRDLESHAERKTITSRRSGEVDRIEYAEYYGARCKGTIDQIDLRLMNLYGFSPEETDFLINYDIKYRMGQGNDDA